MTDGQHRVDRSDERLARAVESLQRAEEQAAHQRRSEAAVAERRAELERRFIEIFKAGITFPWGEPVGEREAIRAALAKLCADAALQVLPVVVEDA